MDSKKPSVKILICYHKPDRLFKDEVFTPIHVGRSNAKKRMGENDPNLKWLTENMIGDDTGDNISDKNNSYNEITALYWAWKNYEELGSPDYIGLMHYRRHFIFRKSHDVVEAVDEIDSDYYSRINYNEDSIAHLFDDCDYVAHIGRVDNIYKHYKENHHIEDLDLAISILKDKYPEYSATADRYLNMSYCNLCNMFILPKKEFFEYCEWLFNILFEFERRVDLTDKRLFISERMTGIFIEHLKSRGMRQKSLSATFLRSKIRIPVAIPFVKGERFAAATLISSVLASKKDDVSVDFSLFCNGREECEDAERLKHAVFGDNTLEIIDARQKLAELSFKETDFDLPRQYPLVLPVLMPTKNKVLYLNSRCLFLRDISDFFITCNNDEFDALTLPRENGGDDGRDVYSINAARLRKYKFTESVAGNTDGKSTYEVFKENSKSGVNSFAWWIYNISTQEKDGALYYRDCTRVDNKYRVFERALLYFDEAMTPYVNVQGLYSHFWWENSMRVPSEVGFDLQSENIRSIMHLQNVSLHKYCTTERDNKKPKQKSINQIRVEKFKRYYKNHGFWKTIKHCFRKFKEKYLSRA